VEILPAQALGRALPVGVFGELAEAPEGGGLDTGRLGIGLLGAGEPLFWYTRAGRGRGGKRGLREKWGILGVTGA